MIMNYQPDHKLWDRRPLEVLAKAANLPRSVDGYGNEITHNEATANTKKDMHLRNGYLQGITLNMQKSFAEYAKEFEATTGLGTGKEHAKFNPGHVYYRGIPEIKVDSENKAKQCVKVCEGLLEYNKNLEIKDYIKWNEKYEQLCEELGAEITDSENDFIFYLESWGKLSCEEILSKALDIIDANITELVIQIEKSK